MTYPISITAILLITAIALPVPRPAQAEQPAKLLFSSGFEGNTTRNHKPIDFIMLAQIYGNANPKYQWVDDIEIWDGLPE